jgi:hypothetical protein
LFAKRRSVNPLLSILAVVDERRDFLREYRGIEKKRSSGVGVSQ